MKLLETFVQVLFWLSHSRGSSVLANDIFKMQKKERTESRMGEHVIGGGCQNVLYQLY